MFRYFNKKALFDIKNSVFIESLFILFPDTSLVGLQRRVELVNQLAHIGRVYGVHTDDLFDI